MTTLVCMMLLVAEGMICPLPPRLPDSPMQPLTKAQMMWVLAEAGWPPELQNEAYWVAGCESTWRPGAGAGVNRGLFQIVFYWPYAADGQWDGWYSWIVREYHLRLDWRDPVDNATAARLIYERSGSWEHWPNCGPEETVSKPILVNKNARPAGVAPAVILTEPKYERNVSMVVRAASAYGLSQVWYTGDRFQLGSRKRLFREERMKAYADVQLYQFDYPFECFEDVVPVAVELLPASIPLPYFEHPERAIYVFGPEDGSISKAVRGHCYCFVHIPTRHCLNLATAVTTVLFHRHTQRIAAGLERPHELAEDRGFLPGLEER